MADQPAPWQVLSKRLIHESPWGINVALWSVRLPDGKIARDHPVLEHARPAVGIVPIADDGRVLMIDHYRVITGSRGWELPAGRVDPGESVDEAARRELLEETGHSAAEWSVLGEYHPANGSSNQVFHLKIARRLTRESEPLDRNETMAMRWFDVGEIRRLLRANEMHDGLSITGITWAIALGILGG
jgi:8-oxo-dGTP pyrophosphatase MutT (NUDIX family)